MVYSRILPGILVIIALACAHQSCYKGSTGPSAATFRPLNPAYKWYGNNRARLDAMMRERGSSSPGYNPQKKPVAVFDWDNTIMKMDVGAGTIVWVVENDKIIQPESWRSLSSLLTPEALEALNAACPIMSPGSALETSSNQACADEIVVISLDGLTREGKPAFVQGTETMEPAYAWAVQLQSGYTPDQVRAFAEKHFDAYLYNVIGETRHYHRDVYPVWQRIYDQMRDLVGALQHNGFDVWICSASCQYIVETAARRIGVDPDHVIGVRPLLEDGKITPVFEGAGTFEDGNQSLITYKKGKRIWINKVIFGLAGEEAETVTGLTTFAAGDSDTDVFFLRDAEYRKLVINRNKREVMCYAYANEDGKWLINPMFILPLHRKDTPYTCTDLTNGQGETLQDQRDSVFW